MIIKSDEGKEISIYSGCSGYKYYRPPQGWKDKYKQKLQDYADHFPLLEINSTFYKLPRVSTAKKWKERTKQVNQDFQFIVKANQRITHLTSNPTYSKADLDINEKDKEKYGFFQPTKQVNKAWEETKKICDALDASVCLFQTPKSFTPSNEHLENLEIFLSDIDCEFDLAFEPRGEGWTKSLIEKLKSHINFVYVFDPFKQEQINSGTATYYRLHGLGNQKYQYKYSNKDLKKLFEICKRFSGNKIYVLFNNYEMHNDCNRFLKYLKKGDLPNVKWGAEAVIETIDIDFPATVEDILSKCGRWWVWVEPNKRIRVDDAFEDIEQGKFSEKEDLLKAIKTYFNE